MSRVNVKNTSKINSISFGKITMCVSVLVFHYVMTLWIGRVRSGVYCLLFLMALHTRFLRDWLRDFPTDGVCVLWYTPGSRTPETLTLIRVGALSCLIVPGGTLQMRDERARLSGWRPVEALVVGNAVSRVFGPWASITPLQVLFYTFCQRGMLKNWVLGQA